MKKDYVFSPLWFFIFAVLLRLAFFLCNYNVLTQIPTATDSFGYFERATHLALHHTYTFPEKDNEVAFWTPGYPFLMMFIFKLFGIKITPLLVIQIFIGSASLTLLYIFILQYIQQIQRKYVALFLLFMPDFILYDVQILTQCLFNAVLLVVAYLLQTGKWKKNYFYTFITGTALGYAILIKSVATFMIFLFILYEIRYEIGHWKKAIILICIAVVSVLPWTIRNYIELHEFVWVHTNTQWNFYLGNHQQSTGAYGGRTSYLYDHTFLEGYTELEREKICKARAWAFIKKHPLTAIKNNVLKISRTFSPRGAWVLYQTGNSKTGVDFAPYSTVPSPVFIQFYSLPFLFIVQMFAILGIATALTTLKQHYWMLMPYLAFLATFFFFVTGTNYVYLILPYAVYLAILGFVRYRKNKIAISIAGGILLLNWIFQYYLYLY